MNMTRRIFTYIILITAWPLITVGQEPRLVKPIGHSAGISLQVFSPDNHYIVTAGTADNDRSARVWETASGKLVFDLKAHQYKIHKLDWSRNGRYILTHAAVPYIWDARSGALLAMTDSVMVNDAGFLNEGSQLVFVRDRDDELRFWDIQQQKQVRSLRWEGFPVEKFWLSADGRYLVSYCYAAKANSEISAFALWDIASGKILRQENFKSTPFFEAGFSPNHSFLTLSIDENLALYRLPSLEKISPEEGAFEKSTRPVFSPGETHLFYVRANKVVVRDLQKEKELFALEGHGANIAGLALMPDSNRVISLDHDGQMRIWDYLSGEVRYAFEAQAGSATGMVQSHDRTLLSVASYNNTAQLLQLQPLRYAQLLTGYTRRIEKLQALPDSTHLLCTDVWGGIRLMNLRNGKIIHALKGHKGEIQEMHVSADGSRLITTAWDSTLRVWDLQKGRELYSIRVPFHVYRSAIQPDGLAFVTWEALENKLSFYETETGKELGSLSLEAGSNTANWMEYSADGRWLLINTAGSIEVREANGGKLLKTLAAADANNTPVTRFTFSHDNKKVAAIADTHLVCWNLETGKKQFSTSAKPVVYYAHIMDWLSFTNLHFDNGGQKIICSAADGTARIFSAENGKELMILDSVHQRKIEDAVITKDGHTILTWGEREGFAISWDADTGEPLKLMGDYRTGLNAVALQGNDRWLVTASEGGLQVYDTRNAALLYKTILLQEQDWLVTDSADHFDGTEAARKLLYFTCNREIIELDQLKDQLWVPGLAERIMQGDSIEAAALSSLAVCGLTPVVEDHSDNTHYLFLVKPGRGGLGETALLVNGIEVKRYKPEQLQKTGDQYELQLSRAELTAYLAGGQDNVVTVKSFTRDNAISSRGLIVNENKTTAPAAAPNLYAVLVGVSDYKGEELDLKYAAKDAADLAQALQAAAAKLLNTDGKEHVFIYPLTTGGGNNKLPGKNAIRKTFEEIGQKAGPNDILLIFFAGHGVMEGEQKQFYFLTADASKATAADAVKDVGISTAELTEWIRPQLIRAQKRILVFDACNSGQAIKDFVKIGQADAGYLAARGDEKAQQVKVIDKLNEKSGLFILSASASNQSAYELGRYAQGLLTYSLLQVIKQQPDILEQGKYLSVGRWFDAAEKSVTELSKENGARQEPQLVSNTNFVIGLVDEEVMSKIVLPIEKPLFAASNFQNSDENIADDDLEFSKLVNLQLSSLASRGTAGSIVYMTATNSPDAYNLSGRYKVEGKKITVTVNLRQKKQVLRRFEVEGTTDKLEELAGKLVEAGVMPGNK